MIPRRLVIASKNPDKSAEVAEVLESLGDGIEIVRGLDWPDVDETESTLEGNALLKARAVVEATGLAAIADDTGLEVAALAGRPGVHTARYAGPGATYVQNRRKLLADLDGEQDRRARFVTVVALVEPDGTVEIAEGAVDGEITRSERGDGGFGYDPIFAVGDRTLAEMSAADKHAISHRGRALRALAEQLARRA